LHLLTFTESAKDITYRAALEEIFKVVKLVHLPKWKAVLSTASGAAKDLPLQVAYFQTQAMRHAADHMMAQHRYDAVHVQHLRMAPYLCNYTTTPRILDLPDAFSLYWQRRKEVQRHPLVKIFQEMEGERVARYEARILPHYDRVLACSPEDIAYLQKKHGATNLSLLPNGVDLATFDRLPPHDYRPGNVLLFTGNMDYAPNVDAVTYFAKEVLPLVRKKHPDVRFLIAGQRPIPRVQDLTEDGAEVLGFVEDMAAMYRRASVVVAPLRFGAGTQNKVLEGMAAGVPVVCSEIGFAGLGVENGEGVILQRDALGFADSVSNLLSSESSRRRIGALGAAAVRARFGWDAIAAQLERYFEEVVASRSGTRSAGGTMLGESTTGTVVGEG
jgi:glycosyltransferase involved in cell wall biosynthesis